MLNHESAQPINVASLQNWIQTTGCLSRGETEYLDAEEDLFCVATQTDTFVLRLELLVERVLVSGWTSLGRVSISPSAQVAIIMYSLFAKTNYISVLSQLSFPGS